jgi:hypothetical protein
MRTIETKVYSFDELNKEAQQKAIEKYRETNEIFLEWFQDDIFEILKDNHNIEMNDLQYSLNYCQGDGLSFTGIFNVNHFVNLCFKDLSQKRKDLFSYFIYKIESKENRGHYCYAAASQINIEVNYNSFYYKKHTNINNMLETFEVFIQDYYLDLCKKFEAQGYAEIEFQNSDGCIIESLYANEYEFTENGTMY